MQVTAIISTYLGHMDGVVFASENYDKAAEQFNALVRGQVVLLHGEEALRWNMDDVWAKYDSAVENGAKVTEYFLDEFEVYS